MGWGRLLILIFGAAWGCRGNDGALPTASSSSLATEKRAASNVGAAAVAGLVSDALDGRPLGGITVEIPGVAAATTGGDGSFTLEAAGLGSVPLVVRGDGFHTRETHLMLSPERALIDILPVGRDFDLGFFDHVFRNLGVDHTERWTVEPRFEIWTGVYDLVETETYIEIVATEERAPERFVPAVREVIVADAPKYTGGVVAGIDIVVVEPHPPGTRFTYLEFYKPFTITVLLHSDNDASFGPSWPYESGAIYSASIWLARRFLRDERQVFSHELAHTLGFHHPAGHENVPLPSIMRIDAKEATSQDQLHGRILYHRPPGSRTADKDPESFVINALRAGEEAGPPDPGLIRWVRN